MEKEQNKQRQAEILAKYLSRERGEVESHDSVNTRRAWDKLHTRLLDENLIPAGEQAAPRRVVYNFLRVAAMAIVLIGTGIVVYLNTRNPQKVEMVRLNTVNETNTLVKTLNDGSVIYIAENSLFSFPGKFATESRNVELKGEAFFDVATSPGKPFIIETGEALIQVLGTAFNVKAMNGKGFELFVNRGKVKVTLKNDPSQSEIVVAGEKISAVNSSLVKTLYKAGEADNWYKQRMHFKDETLQNIIHVLNRNFNTTFAVADLETGKRKLTVTFQNETAETMTELICVTLNLKSKTINGSVVLSENREGSSRN